MPAACFSPKGLLPRTAGAKRDTVLEAGRGVRKLPVPVVKSTSATSSSAVAAPASSTPSKFERLFMSRGFDEAAGPREGGVSRAAVDQPPVRPRDIPVTSLMPPPPTQPQPLTAGQVCPIRFDSSYVSV